MKLADNLTLRKYKKIADKVISRAEFYQAMTDEKLQEQTEVLRSRINSGEKINDILVDAYAVVREADRRILGMCPFKVQVIGGIVLFYGNIAEMRTGEGKTLTATMPMYLSGLIEKGNFLITSNSYLSKRDADQVGRVYRWLGLTVEYGAEEEDAGQEKDRRKVYSADIIYTTNSALGFDYLFDNLSASLNKQYIKQMNFALIDEVDAILLDMAQMPLIISGAPKVQSNLYHSSDKMIKLLKVNQDFELSKDLKSVWFTREGIERMEQYFGIECLLSKAWKELYRHLTLALRANHLYFKNKDYIVENDKVMLLDYINGRKLPGTKLEGGMHQAIEAKESVGISKDSRSMGSITYQNLFRMFRKISGMTGTAQTNAQEFRDTYNLNVLTIPTNKTSQRIDEPDRIFINGKDKIMASVKRVEEEYSRGRPMLIETGSVSLSELYSRILLKNGIPHNLLNARNEYKEAQMVAKAGQVGAVTVATSMAGRGTDIKLGEKAAELGGLLVIGTERMSDIRVDDQLKGRSGRQGEPGGSVFFVSYEDDVVRKNATSKMRYKKKKLERKVQGSSEVFGRKNKSYVKRAQKIQETNNKSSRFQTLEFDNILRIQREYIYKTRNSILRMNNPKTLIPEIFENAVEGFLNKGNYNSGSVSDFIDNFIDYNFDLSRVTTDKFSNKNELSRFLLDTMEKAFANKLQQFSDSEQLNYFLKVTLVKSLDELWIDQVDNLQQLKTVVTGRNWGQHTPIFEYNREARNAFNKMMKGFWLKSCENVLLTTLEFKKNGSVDVIFP